MSVTSRFVIPASLALLAALLVRPSAADEVKPELKAPRFVRLTRDADTGEPVTLQTATVRYRPSSGQGELTVDLIGVVHIGDRAYYRKLDRQLDDYDVLLYELVAPKGTKIPLGGRRSDNPVALLQKVATLVLDLESQTESIDYTRGHFVHADLSPDEIGEVLRQRGDDGLTIALGVAADLIRQMNLQQQKQQAGPAGQAEAPDVLALLNDPEGPGKLKRMLAAQLAGMDSPDAALGQTLSRILVVDRNQAALRVFQKELAKGRKKIGIFYGAAHMPDFDQRLRTDFGLRPVTTQWLTAWDLRREPSIEGLLFKLLMDR
jgi:hypothetical protein